VSARETFPRVVILYGGLSAEAEISVVSGSAIASALMEEGLSVDQLLITREGLAALLPEGHLRGERLPSEYTTERRAASLTDAPGVVQEALAAAGVAYVGAAPAAARLGMEKDAFKRLASTLNVPTLPHSIVTAEEWTNNREATLSRIAEFAARESEGGALIGKPAAHGSSIGMRIARSREEWGAAVDLALQFGARALLEPYLDHPRELEIALLESPDGSVRAFGPGEVFPGREFYDYDAKVRRSLSSAGLAVEASRGWTS